MPRLFKEVFKTPYFSIEATESVEENGDPYYRIVSPDSVICCVLDEQGNFLLVRQYRQNIDRFTYEFPAGQIDDGEKPIEAAIRELHEETGYEANLILLGAYRLAMNRSTNMQYIFFGIKPKRLIDSFCEPGIEVTKIPRKDLLSLVLENRFEQIAALGILQVISLKLNIDVFQTNLNQIYKKFQQLAEK